MQNTLTPFHLAIAVENIGAARAFYGGVLGCPEGRSTEHWVDFNLFGHQLVCHESSGFAGKISSTSVDGDNVPVPHFGVVLNMHNWKALCVRLKENNVHFEIEPHIRFAGQTGEQATMFFFDPSGNALEFKAFQSIESQLFEVNKP